MVGGSCRRERSASLVGDGQPAEVADVLADGQRPVDRVAVGV